MIGLLEISLTHFHDIGEVPADLPEELVTNATLACKQSIERVLVVSGLGWKYIEFLEW